MDETKKEKIMNGLMDGWMGGRMDGWLGFG